MRNEKQESEATECHCGTVPLSHLWLDIAEPMSGWPTFFSEQNVEVAPDDLGRPSVPRQVLAELLTEYRERESRAAAQRVAAAQDAPAPVGVPALDGASPYESMVAAGGVTTPEQDFGRRPKPNFLDEELAEGRRRAAEQRAEAELLENAQRVLDGRD